MWNKTGLFSKRINKISKNNNVKQFSTLVNLVPRLFGLKDMYTKRNLENEVTNDPLLGKLRRKEPIRVTVTGPAGAIGYALVFRLANGELLGPDQPIILNLLELPQALGALKGVEMELRDCAFPMIEEINCTDDPNEAFDGCEIGLMVGSKPRGPGQPRSELLRDNGQIFQKLGQVINKQASTNCRITVVGNPCNTNCLILANNCPDISIKNFTAMTRLDHDRCVSILSRKLQLPSNEINYVACWGNHSESMFVDTRCTELHGAPFDELIGEMRADRYYRNELIPKVQLRGKRIIDVRGSSSAASAANACLAHTRDWCLGTSYPDWVSMGIVSSGQYGVPPGLVFSYPVWCEKGSYRVVSYPYAFNEFQQYYMEKNIEELSTERDHVASFLPN